MRSRTNVTQCHLSPIGTTSAPRPRAHRTGSYRTAPPLRPPLVPRGALATVPLAQDGAQGPGLRPHSTPGPLSPLPGALLVRLHLSGARCWRLVYLALCPRGGRKNDLSIVEASGRRQSRNRGVRIPIGPSDRVRSESGASILILESRLTRKRPVQVHSGPLPTGKILSAAAASFDHPAAIKSPDRTISLPLRPVRPVVRPTHRSTQSGHALLAGLNAAVQFWAAGRRSPYHPAPPRLTCLPRSGTPSRGACRGGTSSRER